MKTTVFYLFLNVFTLSLGIEFKNGLELEFQWNYINFTWPSSEEYQQAIDSKKFIPGSVVPTGMKTYNNKLYFAMPQFRKGVPVTLGTVTLNGDNKSPLVTPFPSWEDNVQDDCETLQSVHGIEIDKQGRLWVLDGTKYNNNTDCPPKIVVYDLSKGGEKILSHTFDSSICLNDGCLLDEAVVDDDFVYISDHSFMDSGLIVYSINDQKAWKLRDSTMFADTDGPKQMTDNILGNMDAIALSPKFKKDGKDTRLVYYSSFTNYALNSIDTKYLKDENMAKMNGWKDGLKTVGNLQSISNNFLMGVSGNLYYVLPGRSAIGVWNYKKPFLTKRIFARSDKDFKIPNALDLSQSLDIRVLNNNLDKMFDLSYEVDLTKVMYTVFKRSVKSRPFSLANVWGYLLNFVP